MCKNRTFHRSDFNHKQNNKPPHNPTLPHFKPHHEKHFKYNNQALKRIVMEGFSLGRTSNRASSLCTFFLVWKVSAENSRPLKAVLLAFPFSLIKPYCVCVCSFVRSNTERLVCGDQSPAPLIIKAGVLSFVK